MWWITQLSRRFGVLGGTDDIEILLCSFSQTAWKPSWLSNIKKIWSKNYELYDMI